MASQLDMYKANQNEIVKEYNGQIIAVKDGIVQGAYPSQIAALRAMQSKFPPETFLIVKCTEGDEEYTAIFHSSRISFEQTGIPVL